MYMSTPDQQDGSGRNVTRWARCARTCQPPTAMHSAAHGSASTMGGGTAATHEFMAGQGLDTPAR